MGTCGSKPLCRRRRKRKDKSDTGNPALLLIREAQQRYYNSHIESESDGSDHEDLEDGQEDSVAFCDSEASITNQDNESVDSDLDNATGALSRHAKLISDTPDSISTFQTSAILPQTNRCNSKSAKNIDSEMNDAPTDNKTTGQTANSLHIPNDAASLTTDTTHLKSGNEKKKENKSRLKVTNAADEIKPAVKIRDRKRRYITLSRRNDFFSIFNTQDKKARSVNPKMYQYPFENIVFEGGGNKGLAYCGAVRLLEELNIWPQIKRLAGTSAGAMTATLLAVGYNSYDLEQFFSLNLNNIFLDHKFGYLSLIPNLLSSYGWNPGKRIYKWFGHKLAEKTGNPDITFREVYDMYKRELCVVTTNLNQMTSLYCHPKTTPDMSVRLAVRMSMSIPGMFKAVKHTIHGEQDVFVDGGVLCNYPIHCFDGWWLSMEPEHNFLEKLQPLEDIPRLLERTERFGQYNEKTLGMQLYSDNEQDLLKYQLENLRHGVQLQALPNTKLAREKIRKKKLQLKTDREHRRLVKAMNAFLRALRRHNLDKNDNIDRGELEAALNDKELFPQEKRLVLFGDVSSDVILQYLDNDQNGQISYNELIKFMEETGINMQNRFLGYQRREINNLPSFLDTLQATLLTNVKRVYVEERDLKRTVGINTGHVGTSDFKLESDDVAFVLERGRRCLEAFLKYYVASNKLKRKPDLLTQTQREDSKTSLISSKTNSTVGECMETSEFICSPEAITEDTSECSSVDRGITEALMHVESHSCEDLKNSRSIGKDSSNDTSSGAKRVTITDNITTFTDVRLESKDQKNETFDELVESGNPLEPLLKATQNKQFEEQSTSIFK